MSGCCLLCVPSPRGPRDVGVRRRTLNPVIVSWASPSTARDGGRVVPRSPTTAGSSPCGGAVGLLSFRNIPTQGPGPWGQGGKDPPRPSPSWMKAQSSEWERDSLRVTQHVVDLARPRLPCPSLPSLQEDLSPLGRVPGRDKAGGPWRGSVLLCVSSCSVFTGCRETAAGRSHGLLRPRKGRMSARRSAGLGPGEQRPRFLSQVCPIRPIPVSPPHPLRIFPSRVSPQGVSICGGACQPAAVTQALLPTLAPGTPFGRSPRNSLWILDGKEAEKRSQGHALLPQALSGATAHLEVPLP